ncbi:MAG TPA: glutathione S-transferase family protein [Polyangia bacterium]
MLSLLIANKSYSSWSLRPWLVLKQAQIPFEERRLSFLDPAFKAKVRAVSPSGKVPALVDGDLVVWDSLAIVEYLAERFPDRRLWPQEPAARAVARSLCAEMHSGFANLRSSLTMNFSASFPGLGWSLKVQRDIDRILAMWADARARFGGGGSFLFGEFSIADAFFAPVAHRFDNYGVQLPSEAARYVAFILGLPAMQQWAAEARAENEFYPEDEPYRSAPGANDRSPAR